MGRVNTPHLLSKDRLSLEQGLRHGMSHCFRQRCQVILLKADGRSSQEVGSIVGMSHISVNSWVKRFKESGIKGLQTKPGQGRKPLLDKQDKEELLEAVKCHRQRLSAAKAEWESSRGKSISDSTLRRFLKVLVEDINA